jgi:hypothetical protein
MLELRDDIHAAFVQRRRVLYVLPTGAMPCVRR